MSKKNSEEIPTQAQIEAFILANLTDNDFECPYCGATIYEGDYRNCSECGEPNPYTRMGLI